MHIKVKFIKAIIETFFMKFSSATTMLVDICKSTDNKTSFYAAQVSDYRLYALYLFEATEQEIQEMLDFKARGGKFSLVYVSNSTGKHYTISTENVIQDELDKYIESDEDY